VGTKKNEQKHGSNQNQRRSRYRLSSSVVPRQAKVSVTVDPEKSDKFKGTVTYRLEIKSSRQTIELHCDGLKVNRPRVRSKNGDIEGTLEQNLPNQRLLITFEKPLPAGSIELQMSFNGELRKDLRGLYLAKAGNKRFAFTQLEAADARRFFPCFDEPSMKIRLALEVTTAASHTVISNSSIEKTIKKKGNRKTVRFKETPPLSTYLFALGVGDLRSSKTAYSGETEIKVWHVEGKEDLCDFALNVAKETLSLLELYFAIPYPYEKLDLVGVPDFEAGAMENAGAVFFRETLLLLDPNTSSMDEKKRVAEVICHELAHMWYGNLVTMSWWDDLWLNEAFATWMAFKIVDSWKPEWRMWHDFQHYRSAALVTDALRSSHPIYTKVRTPDEATENFDVITYEKGASVVRMLETYLSPSVFQEGVRTYISRHREGNTVASDLWQALSEASGFPVGPIVQKWITTKGFPLLSMSRKVRSEGTTLQFSQEPFAKKERKDKPLQEEVWPIPWIGRFGKKKQIKKLIKTKTATLKIPERNPSFIYGNANESGFFRVLHDTAELSKITKNFDRLPSLERQGLLDHQWAIVRAGHASIATYLDLVTTRGGETDPDVLATCAQPLGFIKDRLLLKNEETVEFAERISTCFAKPLRKTGLTRKLKNNLESLSRASLFKLVAKIGENEHFVLKAGELCNRYIGEDYMLDPNLIDDVIDVAARHGSDELYESFWKRASSTKNPQIRRKMLLGLTSFRDQTLTEETLNSLLGDKIDTQDVAILLSRLLHNSQAREKTWAFIKDNWSELERRMPAMLITRPIDALPYLGSIRYKKDVQEFFKTTSVPSGRRALKQALERFDSDERLAQTSRAEIISWLKVT